MMRTTLMILPALLAGCATTASSDTANGDDMMVCKGDTLSQFVGQSVSAELGGAILKASGARTLRWGPPGAAMTMDYRTDRVTVSYDENSKITQASCG